LSAIKKNWDIKRDFARKTKQLEKKTERAMAELIRRQFIENQRGEVNKKKEEEEAKRERRRRSPSRSRKSSSRGRGSPEEVERRHLDLDRLGEIQGDSDDELDL
jgi:hypothetical protein